VKNKVLGLAALLVVAACIVAISTTLLASNPQQLYKLMTVAGILTTGSIGLFFIGAVTPKE